MGRLGLVALLGLVTLGAGCRRTERGPDADGGTDGRSGAAARVVSLSPATTETLFALGAGANVVGRSKHCETPPEVTALPSVGGYADPSLEAILALRPTLVAGARGPASEALATRLTALGVATTFPRTESVAEVQAMITGLGERLGRAREAAAVNAAMDARFAEVARATAAVRGADGGVAAPRVLLVFGKDPTVVAGPGSFPDELLARAGARNAVTEGGTYPTLGLERIALLDPDVVVDASVPHEGGGQVLSAARPGWSTVRAVREGRVRALEDAAPLRPGPRLADGAAALARLVFPGLVLP